MSKIAFALLLLLAGIGCQYASAPVRDPMPRTPQAQPSPAMPAEVRAACDKLRHPDMDVRAQAAIDLRNLGDPAAVPALTDALRVMSSPHLGQGGTERWLPVRIVRKELVTSIEALTRMKFDFPGPPDRNTGGPPRSYDQVGRLEKVVKQAEEWQLARDSNSAH